MHALHVGSLAEVMIEKLTPKYGFDQKDVHACKTEIIARTMNAY